MIKGIKHDFPFINVTNVMDDKIIFDSYYCINSAQNERNNDALYFTASSHFHTRIMLVTGGLQFLIISTCFAWRPVTSISKSHVLTAGASVNCNINAWLSLR